MRIPTTKQTLFEQQVVDIPLRQRSQFLLEAAANNTLPESANSSERYVIKQIQQYVLMVQQDKHHSAVSPPGYQTHGLWGRLAAVVKAVRNTEQNLESKHLSDSKHKH